jgi:hypothetical protein
MKRYDAYVTEDNAGGLHLAVFRRGSNYLEYLFDWQYPEDVADMFMDVVYHDSIENLDRESNCLEEAIEWREKEGLDLGVNWARVYKEAPKEGHLLAWYVRDGLDFADPDQAGIAGGKFLAHANDILER